MWSISANVEKLLFICSQFTHCFSDKGFFFVTLLSTLSEVFGWIWPSLHLSYLDFNPSWSHFMNEFSLFHIVIWSKQLPQTLSQNLLSYFCYKSWYQNGQYLSNTLLQSVINLKVCLWFQDNLCYLKNCKNFLSITVKLCIRPALQWYQNF